MVEGGTWIVGRGGIGGRGGGGGRGGREIAFAICIGLHGLACEWTQLQGPWDAVYDINQLKRKRKKKKEKQKERERDRKRQYHWRACGGGERGRVRVSGRP